MATLGVSSDKTLFTDLIAVNQLLEKHEREAIIRDRDLFWQAYCKTYESLQGKDYLAGFAVKIEGTQLKTSGVWLADVKKAIEWIRERLVNGFEDQKDCKIVAIPCAFSMFLTPLNHSMNGYDLRNLGNHVSLVGMCWKLYIYYPLPALFKTLGATLGKKDTRVTLIGNSGPHLEEATILRFRWDFKKFWASLPLVSESE